MKKECPFCKEDREVAMTVTLPSFFANDKTYVFIPMNRYTTAGQDSKNLILVQDDPPQAGMLKLNPNEQN